jgi:hypothetical protein
MNSIIVLVGCVLRTATATFAHNAVVGKLNALVRVAHPTRFLQSSIPIISKGLL